MSEVHLLVLNYEIVHQGTGFETVYVYIWLFVSWSAK
jgi:hypothetical protein